MKQEREFELWIDGFKTGFTYSKVSFEDIDPEDIAMAQLMSSTPPAGKASRSKFKKKRKPSAYNKFVKEMSKKPRFRYKQTRGNKKKGMVNMKAIAQAWKKKRK